MKREKFSLALSTKIFSVGVPQPRQLPLIKILVTLSDGNKCQIVALGIIMTKIIEKNRQNFNNVSSSSQPQTNCCWYFYIFGLSLKMRSVGMVELSRIFTLNCEICCWTTFGPSETLLPSSPNVKSENCFTFSCSECSESFNICSRTGSILVWSLFAQLKVNSARHLAILWISFLSSASPLKKYD